MSGGQLYDEKRGKLIMGIRLRDLGVKPRALWACRAACAAQKTIAISRSLQERTKVCYEFRIE